MSEVEHPLVKDLYEGALNGVRTIAPPAALMAVGGLAAAVFGDQLVVHEPFNTGSVAVLVFASVWIGYRMRKMEETDD